MDQRDAIAKSRARRNRSGNNTSGAGSVSDSGSTDGDQFGAPRPGAEAVRDAEASRLDERIANKQSRAGASSSSSTASSGRKKKRSSTSSSTSNADGSGAGSGHTGRQLTQLEEDVVAKSRNARRANAGTPLQPGSVPVSSRDQLSQLEDNIQAKMRGQPLSSGGNANINTSAGNPNARAQLNQMERDLATKSRARSEAHNNSSSSSTSRKAPSRSRTQLNQTEQDVLEKQRMGGQSVTKTSGNGSSPAKELNRFEQDLNAKDEAAKSGKGSQRWGKGGADIEANSKAQETFHDEMGDEKGRDGNRTKDGAQKDGRNLPPEAAPPRGGMLQPELEYGSYDDSSDDDLAVAIAVTEEEEDAFIPAAVEYEPDAKPPIYKNRRFRLYAGFAVVLLVVIVVATVIGVTQTASGPAPPTFAPTSYRDSIGIRDQIVSIIGEERMADETTPQARAAEWLINEDPRELPPEAENLIQRYLLALFYIDTTQISPWLSCNKPGNEDSDECEYMRLIRAFPELEYEEVPWYRWLSGTHECEWAGVFCDEFNQTRALELTGQNILGTFPVDMALMPYLQSFTLTWNKMGGPLPTELAQMKHLLNIEVHYNFFTGVVPSEWYEAQALQRINVANNMLSGQLPTEIGQLNTMKGFFAFENEIYGTIPSEMGNMKFLSFTRWGRNFLHGTLPTELGKLEKLQEMWMHRNDLEGPIPSEFGMMKDMADLRLHYNAISGTIPDELYEMKQMKRLDLYDCNITGTISPLISNLRVLQTFRIRENFLSGTIPTEMGLNTKLESVWLHTNDLMGTMPLEVCELRGPRGLRVLDADCNPTTGTGVPMVECMVGCCSACCDRVTGLCFRENEA